MLQFILGGIYTLISLLIGGIIGFAIGTKQVEKAVDKLYKKLNKPVEHSGPVKRITRQEREAERDPVVKKIGELLK